MVVVHEGKLGERGKTRYLIPDEGQASEQFIEDAAKKPRAKGYAEIPMERGRVFRLRGLANDLKLVGSGCVKIFIDEPVRCKTCKADFASAPDLKRHELRTHKEGK